MEREQKRPDPDALLAQIQQAERGRLKIFLGYVAGVGKTYAMLEAAHQRKAEGVDVVAAFVETHGRKETIELLAGLELLPRLTILYHGATLTEMNLDAVLARGPKLALVDELAHTNAPGSRHPKRYQDVEELLVAGVDVYTTVNIQHLESLNDIVFQITGVRVRETVPDRILDEADEIELVDLPTGELMQRLQDGKVYVPDQAARAIQKFFRQGNLAALREMAMRRAAERVDHQMRSYMRAQDISGPWAAGDRILVSLSSHPLGDRLVRAGRKLADDLNAEWFVLFVETAGHLNMPPDNRERVQRNLALAEQLGGKVFQVSSASVTDAVLQFCGQHNITHIVAGRPLRPRWQELFKQSVINEIIRQSGNIHVFVVSEDHQTLEQARPLRWLPHPPLARYLASLALVSAATLMGLALHRFIEPTNLVMIFLAAVVLAALYLGRGPSMLASFLSVLAFDYFMVDPRLSFAVTDTQYLITFTGLLLVGLIISNSAALLRDQMEALRNREQQSRALNRFSQELTGVVALPQLMEIILQYVAEMFNRDAVVLLPRANHLVQQAATAGFELDAEEFAVAEWAFDHGQQAGRGTETLPAAQVRFSPLKTSHGVVGVLGIRPHDAKDFLDPDQKVLLGGVVNLAALSIERVQFAEHALQAETLQAAERLHTALLNSISHQLRTPLATITGVLTGLGESEEKANAANQLDSTTRRELIHSGIRQAALLNRLVENLLNMTRLEAGFLKVNREPGDVQDLVGAVLHQSSDFLNGRSILVNLEENLPAVLMDTVLTGQVLLNLLENAWKYSPPNSPIEICACRARQNQVEITVCDQGGGIPAEDLERVFEKFYRVNSARQTTGTGLGLSICKGIVEAQGGKIWAENNSGRGLTVHFTLEAQEN